MKNTLLLIPGLFVLIVGCAAIMFVGCAANKAYIIHPNSIAIGNDGGAFDSHTADFLSDEHAFLVSFTGKTEPAAVAEALEYANKQYAITKASYLAWRAAQTVANLNALNSNKTQLTAAVGKVAQAGGTQ